MKNIFSKSYWNIFSKSYWTRQVPWTKKQSMIGFLATLTLTLFTLSLITPGILADHHGDDGDWREEAAGILGAAGVIIGAGAKAAGAIIVGTTVATTAPAWVPIATGVGIGLGVAAAGVAVWDLLDGPEDDCVDCDGRGCSTCEPPDDDGCNDCDGSGYYQGGDRCNTCNPPPDNTPNCYYCTDGCSMCDTGAGGYYWDSYHQ